MTFDREVAVFIGLLALCAILVLMILHISEVIAAPSVKCQATPPQANTYVQWRIIAGRKCYYIGRLKLDKGLLYWEPEQPIEVEPMPLPTPAPAIRAESEFEDRWSGLYNARDILDPKPVERWRLWE